MADHIQIGDVSPRIQYVANGAQAQFTYPFPIFAAADLEVYLDAAKQGSGFTVAGAGATAGGLVTFAAAPTAGVVVTLRRKIAIKRTSDFQESGEFRAKVINDELDYQTAALQQVAIEAARAVHLAPTDVTADLTLPDKAARANKFLACDADGNIIPAAGAAGVPVSAFAVTLLDDADSGTVRATLGLVIGANVLAPNGDGSQLTNLPLDAALASDIRLNVLSIAHLNGDRLNMVNGWADPLKDETDIEAAQNVAATFVATGGGYYANNAGGYGADLGTAATHIGSALVNAPPNTVAAAYDGDTSGAVAWGTANSPGNSYIGQDFGAGNEKHIRRVRFATSNANRTASSIKAQYSDNGTTWTDVATFTPVAMSNWDTPYDLPATAAHRYWRILQNGGTTGLGYDWECYEIEWLEAAAPSNMTVVSKSVLAAAGAPTAGRLHVQIKDITGGSAVNTDFKGWVSRDNGTTWTQGTLALVQTLADATLAYEFDSLDIAAQPSGTAPRFKFATFNNKEIQLHGAIVQWK